MNLVSKLSACLTERTNHAVECLQADGRSWSQTKNVNKILLRTGKYTKEHGKHNSQHRTCLQKQEEHLLKLEFLMSMPIYKRKLWTGQPCMSDSKDCCRHCLTQSCAVKKVSWTKALNYHKINMERHDACRHWVRDLVDDFHDESLVAKISNSSHHMLLTYRCACWTHQPMISCNVRALTDWC